MTPGSERLAVHGSCAIKAGARLLHSAITVKADMAIDPITADVIRHRFDAATDEMLVTLVKTAFSPNVKERRDCSAACFDVNVDLISLSASAPMHLSLLMGMVKNIVKR